jgi:GMP synthase-like glutamine amidotransferase
VVKGRGELGRPALDAVLSLHHQAVETLAPGLEVSATAPDGVIEAFEETAPSRWWVATQFHPEWSTHLHWVMGLFGTFIDASRAYSAVCREEIEPWLPEIREWLRQRDSFMYHRAGTSTLIGDTPILPITRRASLATRPRRKVM